MGFLFGGGSHDNYTPPPPTPEAPSQAGLALDKARRIAEDSTSTVTNPTMAAANNSIKTLLGQ